MTKTACLLTLAALFFSSPATLMGQSSAAQSSLPVQPFNCAREKDPVFFNYCSDIDNFLTRASENKQKNGGKVDRADRDVGGALDALLNAATSDPARFTSLQTNVAIQNSLSTLSSGVNQSRPDQQTTAGTNTSGTTSLVEKAGAPAILAFALESGALTRSVSGNTATLTGNADGMIRALTGQQVLCFECSATFGTLGTKVLQNISISAAFLLDQQGTSSVGTSGAANSSTPSSVTSVNIPNQVGKLSNVTARYEVWNHYDPHNSKFQDAWKAAADKAKSQIADKSKALEGSLQGLLVNSSATNDLIALRATYKPLFYADADAGDLVSVRKHFMDLYNTIVDVWTKDDPQFNQKVANVNLSLAEYRALWEQILTDAKGHPLLTLEYTFNKPQSQPQTHDFRAIVAYAPRSALGMLSINAAASIYGDTIPPGAKYGRFHDGQVSAEYDRPIPISGNQNQATFSLAAYWQYQPDPSVLNITAGNLAPGTNIQLPQNAQVLLGTAGSLWVTQAKFTINGKSGIKIPVAFKWSNKTDLLGENKIGAQVGVSYDFSSLSSLFGGSKGQ